MKHGVVTNGRTTTLYGNAATDFMARQMAAAISDQKDALEKVRSIQSAQFRERFVAAARALGYKISDKLIAELNTRDVEVARARDAVYLKHRKAEMQKHPLIDKKTRSMCVFCKRPIKGPYYDGGNGNRAHQGCC